jgi:catechol 2,3-dioxygenase-like lactoylglutathione lyase family enzyme
MLDHVLPRLHHVGIVLPSFAAAERHMQVMGFEESYRGEVPEFQCHCLFLASPPGQPCIELVVPSGGPLAKFNKGTGGVHHYALLTNDILTVQADFAARGIPMLRDLPVRGAGNFLCNFVDPLANKGVLVEYVQLLG